MLLMQTKKIQTNKHNTPGGGVVDGWKERRKKGMKRKRLWKTQEERLRKKEGEKTEISTPS